MITKSVEGTYNRFVHWVTQNRKKSFAEIDSVGGGRVWSGVRAKQIGLVDELGTLNNAVAFAAQKAKLKDYNVKAYPKKQSPFEQFFKDLEEDEISTRILKNKLGEDNYRTFEMFTNPKLSSPIIMETPYRISIK